MYTALEGTGAEWLESVRIVIKGSGVSNPLHRWWLKHFAPPHETVKSDPVAKRQTNKKHIYNRNTTRHSSSISPLRPFHNYNNRHIIFPSCSYLLFFRHQFVGTAVKQAPVFSSFFPLSLVIYSLVNVKVKSSLSCRDECGSCNSHDCNLRGRGRKRKEGRGATLLSSTYYKMGRYPGK